MKNGSNGSKWFNISKDSRSWEEFYRKRWNYDYSVRTGMELIVEWHVAGKFL